jgi:hypothetical protein
MYSLIRPLSKDFRRIWRARTEPVAARPGTDERSGLPDWLLTTDHKRIGILTISTALFLFFLFGALALTMRAQLAQPNQHVLSPQAYLQFMTMHGTGMITLAITPLALGLGVYLIPLTRGPLCYRSPSPPARWPSGDTICSPAGRKSTTISR